MIKNKKILSVITARAGSKGIKNKNIRELDNEPLFVWSVLASLQSEYIDKTAISSDSEEIEKIYKSNIKKNKIYVDDTKKELKWKNVVFIKRPDEISGDFSINEEALIYTYNEIRKIEDIEYDIILNLQPTSPCRFSGLIDKCIEEYDKGGHKSLFTAQKYTPFFWKKVNGKWEYIDRYFEIKKIKRMYQENAQWQMVKGFDDCCNRKMRQEFIDNEKDSEFLMHDNGSVYITDTKILLLTKCRISKKHMIYETNGIHNLQIDYEYDFGLIKNMLKANNILSPIGEVEEKLVKKIPDGGIIIYNPNKKKDQIRLKIGDKEVLR